MPEIASPNSNTTRDGTQRAAESALLLGVELASCVAPGLGFRLSGPSFAFGVAGVFGSLLANLFFKLSGDVFFGGAQGFCALGWPAFLLWGSLACPGVFG
jgi:hypothetical protein